MTVSIDIDLDAMGAIQEIAHLRVALESLEDDLDIDLDLDGDLDDTLDELSETMDNLSESFNSDLNETIDRLENLEFDDITVLDGNGDSGGDTGSDSGDYTPTAREWFSGGVYEDNTGDKAGIQQAIEKFHNNVDGLGDAFELAQKRNIQRSSDGGGSSKSKSMNSMIQDAMNQSGFGDFESTIRKINSDRKFTKEDGKAVQKAIDQVYGKDGISFDVDSRLTQGQSDGDIHGSADGRTMSLSRYKEIIDGPSTSQGLGGSGFASGGDTDLLSRKKLRKLKNGIDSAKKSFKGFIPSMSTWINIVGALIPVLGAMAVQALGVASAMGAMAVAGAGIIGLGLIGHGDSMAESFRNAKEEVNELKKGLFEQFEPTADLFSGIQADFFDFVPGQMTRVAESMEGLITFEDDLFSLFRGATKFIAGFFNIITSKSDIVSGLTKQFSRIIGSSILDFFGWLLETADNNKEMLIDLGEIFKVVAITVYHLFMAVSRAIVMLKPFFGIFIGISKLLNNRLISAFVGTMMIMYAVIAVVSYLITSFMGLGMTMLTSLGPAISSMIVWMASYIGGAAAMITSNTALAASIGLVSSALLTLMAISGAGLILAGIGMAAKDMISPDVSGQGYGASGRGAGGSTTVNEGDTVNVNIGDAETSTIEKFSDMGTGGDRGPTAGNYTSD